MKAVIVAGGKGTRLGRIGDKFPKGLLTIDGKPVLEHQIELLTKNGFEEVWLLTGYKGEMIRRYFGNGKKWGIKIYYSQEKKSLGTGGAVKSIAGKLPADFLVLYGDVMVNFDIRRFVNYHRRYGKDCLATIVVHPNDHPLESDLVEVRGSRIEKIYLRPHDKDIWLHNLAIAAVYILSSEIFPFIPSNQKTDFSKDIFPELIKRKKILAYKTWEYFKDMGSPNQLKTVRQDIKRGIYQQLNCKKKQRAIFLDRDGVINEETDELTNIDDLRIYPFSYPALKKVNQSGFHAVVITNQPMIAKGKLTEKKLDEIHRKMETLLGRRGIKIDRIYYCPHHPERGWKGEIKSLKIKCSCRKPNIGLIKKATKDFNIDLSNSYYIGDSLQDFLTAKRTKIKFVGVETGYGCRDLARYDKLATGELLVKKNLNEAMNYILKL